MRLTACDVLEVGMVERPKFVGFGAVRAARSPNAQRLAAMLDPMRGPGLFSQDANGKPMVKINYIQDQEVTPTTAFTCAVGTKGTTSQTTFVIDKYLKDGLSFEMKEYSDLCNGVDAYLSSLSPNVSLNFGGSTSATLAKFGAVGQLKDQIHRRLNSAFMQPLNNYVLSKLAPGYNPLRESLVRQPTKLKDATGHYVEDFLEELNALKMTTGYCGKYIAIGGVKWATWFSNSCGMPNIHCCSELGVNFQTVRDSMPFEFYLDTNVDTMYGAGTLILIEEDSLAMVDFKQNQFLPSSICCEEYGNLSVQLAACCEPSFTLTLETFSEQKGKCATTNKPAVNVHWEMTYDVWTKPHSFTHPDSSPLHDDTGIYHYFLQ